MAKFPHDLAATFDDAGEKDMFVGRDKQLEFLRKEVIELRCPVFIFGPSGVGKTPLVHVFAEKNRADFPGGIFYTYGYGPQKLQAYIEENIPLPLDRRTLLVIDESNNLPEEQLTYLQYLREYHKLLDLVLVGAGPGDVDRLEGSRLAFGGLTRVEFGDLLRKRIDNLVPSLADRFFKFFDGNPAVVDAATSSVRNGLFNASQLFEAFEDFQISGILGPDGKPRLPSLTPPERLVVGVREVNAELIALLKAEPELLRKIAPRKFEEIIAELLTRQGYKIELTPATRDRGFDMYAAKSDNLGAFLFLIECKRYTPPSNVGVQVVRSVYGTLQQSKATAGIIATTSFFTAETQEFQREVKYQLQLRDFFEIKKWLGLI